MSTTINVIAIELRKEQERKLYLKAAISLRLENEELRCKLLATRRDRYCQYKSRKARERAYLATLFSTGVLIALLIAIGGKSL